MFESTLPNVPTSLGIGSTFIGYTYATLFPDLSAASPTRTIRIVNVSVQVCPIVQTSFPSFTTYQLSYVDPVTLSLAPMSRLSGCSHTSSTLLRGTFPSTMSHVATTSTVQVLSIYFNSVIANTVYLRIVARGMLVRDV
jgi:hypothetical protein